MCRGTKLGLASKFIGLTCHNHDLLLRGLLNKTTDYIEKRSSKPLRFLRVFTGLDGCCFTVLFGLKIEKPGVCEIWIKPALQGNPNPLKTKKTKKAKSFTSQGQGLRAFGLGFRVWIKLQGIRMCFWELWGV